MNFFTLNARLGRPSEKRQELCLQKEDCIYLMGIGGAAMANLAVGLKQQGFRVYGSDFQLYEPMLSLLKNNDISVLDYDSKNLSTDIKLVVVGNVIKKSNPEVQKLYDLKLPYISFAEFLEQAYLKEKKKIVVAGTHGKSSTTALMVAAAQANKQTPSFFIGAFVPQLKTSFKISSSDYFIIEGDEYDTAFFAKHPKFYHYHPHALILTSLEFDHADIYKDLEAIKLVFQKLVSRMPKSSYLLACSDNLYLKEIQSCYQGSFFTYGEKEQDDYQMHHRHIQKGMQTFEVTFQQKKIGIFETPLLGRHNALNVLSVIALSHIFKWNLKPVFSFLKSFQGVEKRLQQQGEYQGVCLYEDFAHHPTAVKNTIAALKERFPEKRLVAIFEPRSFTSRLNTFQNQYTLAFQKADLSIIAKAFNQSSIDKSQRFSSKKLVQDLKEKGFNAFYADKAQEIIKQYLPLFKKGDIVLVMSNGSFSGLLTQLKKALVDSFLIENKED